MHITPSALGHQPDWSETETDDLAIPTPADCFTTLAMTFHRSAIARTKAEAISKKNKLLHSPQSFAMTIQILKSPHFFDSNLIFTLTINFYISYDSSGIYYFHAFFSNSGIQCFPQIKKCIVA
jgi:hypothetical protein